jgi:hypothetical protein
MWIEMAIALQGLLLSGVGCMTGHQVFRGTKTFQPPGAQRRPTADQAKPFLGEWTSIVDGPSGPTSFIIEITVTEGRVLATVKSDLMGENQVHDITETDKGIALRYTGSLWGYSAPVVLTLVANGDELQEDFSIWWFQFRGVGRKSHSRAE